MGRFVYGPVGSISLVLAVALGGLCGCGASNAPLKKRVAELSQRLTELQKSQDRLTERLSNVENRALSQVGHSKSDRGAAGREDASGRPDLEVVKLAPSEASDANGEPTGAAPSERAPDEERPVIYGEGSRIQARNLDEPKAPASTRARR